MQLPVLTGNLRKLLSWRAVDVRRKIALTPDELPLRAELLSVDQLDRHARALAASHELAAGRSDNHLLKRLDDNERVLVRTYDLVSAAAELNGRIEPAADWLLDNFYLVEEQIRAIRRLLPPSYSRELPRLLSGDSTGLPRVYAIAMELIAHVDGRVEAASMNAFVSAYQSSHPLALGELWAVPLMLRLASIENLRRIAMLISTTREDRNEAALWAGRMVSAVDKNPTDLILVLADMTRADPPLTGAFLSELTRHLQGQNPNFAFANSWLEHRLTDQGLTTEQLVRSEGQAQAADQVSIGNSFNSLRFINAYDWRTFVEQQSLVEQTLAGDPAGVYLQMDFATRDRYRHAVEGIARRSHLTEYDVARKAVQLAEGNAKDQANTRSTHVGYFLVDRGRPVLERVVEMRFSYAVLIDKIRRTFPLTCYLTSIVSLVTVIMFLFLRGAHAGGLTGLSLWFIGLCAISCSAGLAIAIVNWFVTKTVSPQWLSRMDFQVAIPAEHRTLVAIPTMLASRAGVETLLDGLEVRYLSNRDASIHFALLTDFPDAATETLSGDTELIQAAVDGIDQLNAKYAPQTNDIFFLFHRSRLLNDRESTWMGYERKRGKLADLNATLRGATDRFSAVAGATEILAGVRYVITLDTDTQLPRDSARMLIGTLAHPLNRPVFDRQRGRVVDGYTILQPRVAISLSSAKHSRFSQLFSGDAGIDPYTRAVSDVYQDLFGEGSFIGKGIYEVDSFEQCCGDFPENTILSHDLLEGAFCRSGLLSDVTLYEGHPSQYAGDMARRYRWVRGDWQIASWLRSTVRGTRSKRIRNPISLLSKWKIFDNLRRSIAPIALLVLIIASWIMGPAAALAVLILVATVIALPTLLASLSNLLRKPSDLSWQVHMRESAQSLVSPATQQSLALAVLPYEAIMNADAIVRTLTRMFWTQRRLLEWRTSSDSERASRTDLVGTYRAMIAAPVIALLSLAFLLLTSGSTIWFAIPWLVAWTASPLIAWWISCEVLPPKIKLLPNQYQFLDILARKTWRYFEEFVTEADNWLPPDNVQQNPDTVIASRTSPTNIGMAFLSDLSAHDFGYCSTGTLLRRTQAAFGTLEKLQRYRGHFFNWYDTRTLEPLHPRYISMVDSGNLGASLLVLSSGFAELSNSPVLSRRLFRGLVDTLRVIVAVERDAYVRNTKAHRTSAEVLRRIDRQIETLSSSSSTLTATVAMLQHQAVVAAEIVAMGSADAEVVWWMQAYQRACADHHSDLIALAPWIALPEAPQGFWSTDANTDRAAVDIDSLQLLRSQLVKLDTSATLNDIARLPMTVVPCIEELLARATGESHEWLMQLRDALWMGGKNAADRIALSNDLARSCQEFADMDYSLMYCPARELFATGYNFSDRRLDASFYDLLASEARLVSYIVVAQGNFGQEHWFALGRLLTSSGRMPALLSWSGSMFEYLMPLLVMPNYEHTLLDRTYHAIVQRQIGYGQQRGVPWGISESGYNAIDAHRNYQYKAFGVPGLGLKRGLAEDLVIAPYASVLALMVAPEAACRNLERLKSEGMQGSCGMFESVDYTPSRLPPGASSVVVRQFMAHHQGMSLLSLAYLLLDKPMQRRFLADPVLRAADLLLQERVPRATSPVFPHAREANATRLLSTEDTGRMRVITEPNNANIEAHLLSNGQYHVAVTSSGGGYSRWKGIAITRWREDATCDSYGSFCYIRDIHSGNIWSNSWNPTKKPTKNCEAIFTQSRVEFRRLDDQIETYTQISVSPEDDIELRRVTFTNRSEVARTLEVTSYAEVVLAPQAQDTSHPAFSNLFVQTEIDHKQQAIYCTRRPRSTEDRPPWMLHMMTIRGTCTSEPSYETDRMRFVGRYRTLESPQAMQNTLPLSNTDGPVLDPVVSMRQTLVLQPNESVQVDIVTGVAENRAGVEAQNEKYRDSTLADRVFELAWTHSQILLRQLNASESDAQAYSRMAGSIIYASSLHRAKRSILARNERGQSGLWGYGISGDVPIVLVRIRDHEHLDLVRHAVQMHAYWRLKGLVVELVIWNEDDSVYRQTLQEAIADLVAASPEAAFIDRPGGIFIRRGEQMSAEDRSLLQTVARVVLQDDSGTFSEQIERRGKSEILLPLLKPVRRAEARPEPKQSQPELAYFNGIGGFSQDGREYICVLPRHVTTPAPWVNVIANDQFGSVVSESGSAYTWSENSHEYRLTPWNNDAVSDRSGEVIYMRDEETGQVWSPTPLPIRGKNDYVIRHGFGYTIFNYTEDGITTELCVYVDTVASVKFCKLKVTNNSGRSRQLSATAYWELVLGDERSKTLMHVVTEVDSSSGAILARNPYSPEFGDRVAFFNCSERTRTYTNDRTEFLGRNGSLANAAAMRRVRLSNHVGAGYDPCAAIQAPITLAIGQERTITFTMGAAQGHEQAKNLAQQYSSVESAHRAIEKVWDFWSRTLGAVHVETPDASVNFLANGWLIYQTLACRMWARSGFYQSGGAFGFRDQLQDAMALVHTQPHLLREHLLRAAAHQFREGDVQHWWHPPIGRGVRTQFSDDYLWLPLATCRYVAITGDTGVLEESVPFLNARLLRDDEESNYDLPQISDDTGSLYEHCLRAINRGLRFGEHGLPLMGCGDWNDGMNLVGQHGKGESVWLAFFMLHVLSQFETLARERNDISNAERFNLEAGRLRGNIEEHGWDGKWYRRAYFDDGTPLGSTANEECQIDAISQSWSVLSGGGTPDRVRTAMKSVEERLVREEDQLILLLDPPFDHSSLNPGYIKGYLPGVRENGGQYTHSAIWTVMATAAIGNTERAWELFNLINPIRHGSTAGQIANYRVEPYVVAADVYGVPPHLGRGGWTWYTGSAGWMYRLIVESLIGLQVESDRLRLKPSLPAAWDCIRVHYRYRQTQYHITIHQSDADAKLSRYTLDGNQLATDFLPLTDDDQEHYVDFYIAPR